MKAETFFAEFGHLADAPDGVAKLRALILDLAVRGKLVPQDPNDEPASVLLEQIKKLNNKSSFKKYNGFHEEKRGGTRCCLPSQWKYIRLADSGSISGGGTPSKNNSGFWEGDIPWVSPKDMKTKYIFTTIQNITDLALEKTSLKIIPKNSILIVGRSGILKRTLPVSINKVDCTVNQDIKCITLFLAEITNYITLCLRGMESFILKNFVKGGVTVQSLKYKELLAYPFPLPPLAEQKRIVAKVDELMVLCDELETRQKNQQQKRLALNKVVISALLNAEGSETFTLHWRRIRDNFDLLYDRPETIAELRQAILQLAVMGKLVPQDPNLKQNPNRNISDNALGFELPQHWHALYLGDLTSLITSGSRGWKIYYSASGSTFIRTQDIKNDKLEYDQRVFVSLPQSTEGKRTKVKPGDLLITITGANVGKAAILKNEPSDAYVSQHIALVRLIDCRHSPFIHKWLVGSFGGRRLLLENIYGAKPGLNLKNIRELPVPIPPLEEQKRIVAKVDELMALCDRLEAGLTQERQKSAALLASAIHHLTV